jgi:hypothetical protein
VTYHQADLAAEEEPQVHAQWPGEAGTWQTVSMMRTMARESALHPWIRDRAVQVTAHCDRDTRCQCLALYGYVKNILSYVKDPTDMEALHHPVTWIERRLRTGQRVYGDCDDAATYLAALLRAIGHRPRFRVLGQRDRLHHISVVCHNIFLDTTVQPGVALPHPQRAIQVPV